MWKQRLLVTALLGLAFSIAFACSNDGSSADPDGGTDSDADSDSDSDSDGDSDYDLIPTGAFPSSMPPGDLDPQNAPQIIVFGFDDCMFTGNHPNDTAVAPDNGMNFVTQTFGPMTNPDGSDAHVSFYVNGSGPSSNLSSPRTTWVTLPWRANWCLL